MKKTQTLKKSLKNKINKNLALYSAVAGAVALAADSSKAEIIYTDIDPDAVLSTSGDVFQIDFEQSGTNQFTIVLQFNEQSIHGTKHWIANQVAIIADTPNASWRSDISSSPGYGSGALALNKGQFVYVPNAYWGRREAFTDNMAGYSTMLGNQNGDFINSTNKFVGAKFKISGNTHYGWINVQVNSNATKVTITGYAYNSAPDGNIKAGILIVPEPNSLFLLALGALGLSQLRKKRAHGNFRDKKMD